jgi:hypothetical protein
MDTSFGPRIRRMLQTIASTYSVSSRHLLSKAWLLNIANRETVQPLVTNYTASMDPKIVL